MGLTVALSAAKRLGAGLEIANTGSEGTVVLLSLPRGGEALK